MIGTIIKGIWSFAITMFQLLFFFGFIAFAVSLIPGVGVDPIGYVFNNGTQIIQWTFPEERSPVIPEPDFDFLIATRKELANPEENIMYVKKINNGYINPKPYDNLVILEINDNQKEIKIQNFQKEVVVEPNYNNNVLVLGRNIDLDYQNQDYKKIKAKIKNIPYQKFGTTREKKKKALQSVFQNKGKFLTYDSIEKIKRKEE